MLRNSSRPLVRHQVGDDCRRERGERSSYDSSDGTHDSYRSATLRIRLSTDDPGYHDLRLGRSTPRVHVAQRNGSARGDRGHLLEPGRRSLRCPRIGSRTLRTRRGSSAPMMGSGSSTVIVFCLHGGWPSDFLRRHPQSLNRGFGSVSRRGERAVARRSGDVFHSVLPKPPWQNPGMQASVVSRKLPKSLPMSSSPPSITTK